MCKLCETKPVYEFTNQRKLCATCFVRWFKKKSLYTIRKFAMIKNGDVVGFEKGKDFRSVVLEDVLKMIAENRDVGIVKLPSKKANKIAVTDTTDVVANEIVEEVFYSKIDAHMPVKKQGKSLIICPLYLFLDKEVLLYAKLRKLKFENSATSPTTTPNSLNKFLNELEQKHPEVKQAVVQGWLRIKNNN